MPSGHGWPLPPADPTRPTAVRDPPPIESARRYHVQTYDGVFFVFFSFPRDFPFGLSLDPIQARSVVIITRCDPLASGAWTILRIFLPAALFFGFLPPQYKVFKLLDRASGPLCADLSPYRTKTRVTSKMKEQQELHCKSSPRNCRRERTMVAFNQPTRMKCGQTRSKKWRSTGDRHWHCEERTYSGSDAFVVSRFTTRPFRSSHRTDWQAASHLAPARIGCYHSTVFAFWESSIRDCVGSCASNVGA